jgi:hypothetical protein
MKFLKTKSCITFLNIMVARRAGFFKQMRVFSLSNIIIHAAR